MKMIHYISLLAGIFLLACTSDKDTFLSDVTGKGKVNFLMNVELGNSDNLQHVEKIYLYVFKGTDGTATYVQTKEYPWVVSGNADYSTTSAVYSISLDPGAYTFLAVGVDNKAGITYNLPDVITNGTILSEAKATLAAGRTKSDIAQSELFAGYVVAPNVQVSGNAILTIKLSRRIAGVVGWFKNIPYRLPNIGGGTDIKKMTVELYTNPNKAITLQPATANDYGESPFAADENGVDNKIVLEYDLIGYSPATGKNYYDVTLTDANNILQAGSYILPVKMPEVVNKATLTLRYYDALGMEILGTSRVILLASSTQTDGTITDINTITFPLEANQLYSIGTKDDPIDLDPGLGNEIVITVNPMWEGISDDIPLEW